uniref:Similar to n=1 Tax=Loa loa TaxID=7209 RepID=A0A1I7VA57_LOALO
MAISYKGMARRHYRDTDVSYKKADQQLHVFTDHQVNFLFRHAPSEDNPVDIVTKGLFPVELRQYKLWWEGPSWLTDPESGWPQWEYQSTEKFKDKEERIVAKVASQTIETEGFNEEEKKKRNLYCDDRKLWRSQSRLENSELDEESKIQSTYRDTMRLPNI